MSSNIDLQRRPIRVKVFVMLRCAITRRNLGHAVSMSTVIKALSLLDHFDASAPEIGLVDMARLSSLDKATTRRLLVALSVKGFIEQDPLTRRYRLGAALIR